MAISPMSCAPALLLRRNGSDSGRGSGLTPESIPSLAGRGGYPHQRWTTSISCRCQTGGTGLKPHWISSPCWKWRRALAERFASRQPKHSGVAPAGDDLRRPHRLMRLFNNLLENSLRFYTDSGGGLHITARRSGRMLVIDCRQRPGVSDGAAGPPVRTLLPGGRIAQPRQRHSASDWRFASIS